MNISQTAFALFLLLSAGCVPGPGTGVAEEAIRSHFEEKGYRVVDLKLGKISRNPVADRVYMGPLTFVVEVKSIVLEDEGTPSRKQSFSNASVKMYSLSAPQEGWVVSQISGIDISRPD